MTSAPAAARDGQHPWPGYPARRPGRPVPPDWPLPPGEPPEPDPPRPPQPSPPPGVRVWLDPVQPGSVQDRLLERRIVLASGLLDGDGATRLSAQLLTLDAEGDEPIRLELQGLTGELSAVLTVMGVLDVVGVPVHGYAGGRLAGPALGVLAACDQRRAYRHAVFAMAEPRLSLHGSAAELAAQEEQLRVMLDELYFRLAEVTGQEVDDIRADARRGRLLTAEQAIGYGLLHGPAVTR